MDLPITISVDELLREHYPRLERLLPRSLKERLERALCIDRMNGYIIRNHNRATIDFLGRFLRAMDVGCRVEGVANLRAEGRYTIVANHPLGGLDGIALAWTMLAHMGDVKVVVNEVYMKVRPLQPLWLPVRRMGRQSADMVRAMYEALCSDVPIVTFPAGCCSRRRGGEIVDAEWHPSFVRRSINHNRTIVPVYVEGRLSNRFYRMAWLRRIVGLKTSFEMYLLPSEMYRCQGSEILVRIGAPIPVSDIADMGSSVEACRQIRERVYAMRLNS